MNEAEKFINSEYPDPAFVPPGYVGDFDDRVLLSIAILSLVTAVADGDPDYREIEHFITGFEQRYSISRSRSLRIIGQALRLVSRGLQPAVIDNACDHLNGCLSIRQRMEVFEGLAELAVIDGRVVEGEELLLEYLLQRLAISSQLYQFSE